MASGFDRGAFRADLTAATSNAAGGVLSIANPEGEDLIITSFVLNVTTKSTGAATLDIGIAANGTTSKDTLLDGVDVGTAAGVFDNITNKGTNGKTVIVWGASEYLTATASATVAGIVGEVVVEYIHR